VVCPHCKRQLADRVKFCSYCGRPISAAGGTPPSDQGFKSPGGTGSGAAGHAKQRLPNFWQRISEGLTLHLLWEQFTSEARASYSLYAREVDWEELQKETRFRRFLKIARALFWAMVMKLSPARRVILLIALLLGIMDSRVGTLVGTDHGTQAQFTVNFLGILAFGLMLLLLALELADRVTMKRDLEIAREIQGWLVPKAAPTVEGIDIAFATRPANTVAGDYYDAFLRPRSDGATPPSASASAERLLLVVADVAGKSVPAALLMATFQASLRTLAASPVSLRELVAGLNDYACRHSMGGRRFTTAFFAELDPRTLSMEYINAGHNPPILRRTSAEIVRLEEGGLPLGVRAEATYSLGTVSLGHGDLLAVLTDGVVEAENDRGEEYGENRLLELFRGSAAGTSAEELQRLMSSLDQFVGAARQHDDITCLMVQTT
jgi:phosphoserine phosphatase RsbU/P